MIFMKKIKYFFFISIFLFSNVFASDDINFDIWKNNFKKRALENNISEKTFDLVMSNTKFLPNVIKYDRYQPEFYEDTKTYITKRSSLKKLRKGVDFYSENIELINFIEKKYNIEKELLLSLMGIETNFGTYVGKMDILSSLRFIFSGKIYHFMSIYRAHFHYYLMLRSLLSKRNNSKIRSNYFKINSIVYKYFVQGKKKFFQL